jgi:hypothetical protein
LACAVAVTESAEVIASSASAIAPTPDTLVSVLPIACCWIVPRTSARV